MVESSKCRCVQTSPWSFMRQTRKDRWSRQAHCEAHPSEKFFRVFRCGKPRPSKAARSSDFQILANFGRSLCFAAGQKSDITTTIIGSFMKKGLIDIKRSTFVRLVVTHGIAVRPALVVSAVPERYNLHCTRPSGVFVAGCTRPFNPNEQWSTRGALDSDGMYTWYFVLPWCPFINRH
jgi:hypothetical protein